MAKAELAPVQLSIEDVLKKRRKKETYDVVPTYIEGVALRVEAGVGEKLDILKKTIGRLAIVGADFAARKARLKELTKQQEEPEEEIKGIAQTHEGLRGVQSELDNFKLNVFPRPSITWNVELLKESLGIVYPSVVSEDLAVSISIPLGYKTKKGPLDSELLQEALIKGLVGLGLPKAELGLIVDPQVVPRVDEAKLADLLAAGRVSLLEGAGEVTETWAITVDPLRES